MNQDASPHQTPSLSMPGPHSSSLRNGEQQSFVVCAIQVIVFLLEQTELTKTRIVSPFFYQFNITLKSVENKTKMYAVTV